MRKYPNLHHFYRRHRQWLVPLGCWILYIAYEQLAIYLSQGRLSAFGRNLFYYGLNIGVFYGQRYILNRLITKERPRYLQAISWSVALLLLFLAIKMAGDYFFIPSSPGPVVYYLLLIWDLYRSIYFIGLSVLIWAAAHMEIFRQTAADAEKQQLILFRDRSLLEMKLAEAQNAYYQHQLNPHLLFNTLNFIYNGVYDNSPAAAKGVLLLSDILRFSLQEGDEEGKVTLAEECAQIKNLLAINHLRFDGKQQVNFQLEGVRPEFRIIPLILLTLTENLFKHGLTNDPEKPASLAITVDPRGKLVYRCDNFKKNSSGSNGSRQQGLRNVRIRLEQAYGAGHALHIAQDKEQFHLDLTLQL